MKVIIVGGVAGGATAAARIRRLDEHAEIIVFEKDPDTYPMQITGFPYYSQNLDHRPRELLLQTPEEVLKRFTLNIRNSS